MAIFISFEGAEAAGKSTQLNLLAGNFARESLSFLTFREPGGTKIGEQLRQVLVKKGLDSKPLSHKAELLLMCASRVQLVEEEIRPSLNAGISVLTDRFFDSTFAYQCYGRGMSREIASKITTWTVGTTIPDLTFYLDLPRQVAIDRLEARNNSSVDRFDQLSDDFFERVRQGFEAQFKDNLGRFRKIDATKPADEIASIIWKETSRWLHSDA